MAELKRTTAVMTDIKALGDKTLPPDVPNLCLMTNYKMQAEAIATKTKQK
jgi:hypothetical protein